MYVLHTTQDTPIYCGLLMRRTYPVLGRFDSYDDACGYAFNVCGFATSHDFFIDVEVDVVRVYHCTGKCIQFVAEVSTTDLDEAYALTNHIDSDWTLNDRVRALAGAHRSTSVGDMLEYDGDYYAVEAHGFKRIGGFEDSWYWMCVRNRHRMRSVVACLRNLIRRTS